MEDFTNLFLVQFFSLEMFKLVNEVDNTEIVSQMGIIVSSDIFYNI